MMFRINSIGEKISYSVSDSVAQAMEDYELWLRLIYGQQQPPKFANIGTVLVYLRKHSGNKSSGIPIIAEIPLKARYLTYHVKGALQKQILENNEIVEEFIKLTGR